MALSSEELYQSAFFTVWTVFTALSIRFEAADLVRGRQSVRTIFRRGRDYERQTGKRDR